MYYAGIDIGGTKIAVVLGKLEQDRWKILSKESFATQGYPNEILARCAAILNRQTEKIGSTPQMLSGIGISCGGPLDSQNGRILSPPNLPGWDDIPITTFFQKKYQVTSYLQNDANACAVAEWKFGAGKGTQNMIFLTFGTGLGAGLILNGRLYTGTNDMAGEIGHIRLAPDGPMGYGKSGSMEGFCSGGGISQLGRQKVWETITYGEYPKLLEFCGSPENITAKAIAELADNGDHLCQDIYHISGEMLGKGLSILIDLLNPEAIVIGSIFTRSQNLLWESMRAVLEQECLSQSLAVCRILPSGLGENLGDIAALTVSLGNLQDDSK